MKDKGISNSSLIQERNADGKIIKEYRGEGKPHRNIERPNVKETTYNTNPETGKTFQNKSGVRKANPDEIPK